MTNTEADLLHRTVLSMSFEEFISWFEQQLADEYSSGYDDGNRHGYEAGWSDGFDEGNDK